MINDIVATEGQRENIYGDNKGHKCAVKIGNCDEDPAYFMGHDDSVHQRLAYGHIPVK